MLLPRKPGIPEDFRMTETETAVPSTGSAGESNVPRLRKEKRQEQLLRSTARSAPRARRSHRLVPQAISRRTGNPAPRLLLQVPASARTVRETEARAAALSATAREEAETDPREAVRETEARAAVLLATVRTVREIAPVFRDGRTAEAMTAEEGLTAGAEGPEAIGRESPRRLWISA